MRTITRLIVVIACASCASCAEESTGLLKGASDAVTAQPPAAMPVVTADDLQNLVVCARRTLPSLSADEIAAVAASIKHAEAAIVAMRTPPEPPKAEPKPEPKAKP